MNNTAIMNATTMNSSSMMNVSLITNTTAMMNETTITNSIRKKNNPAKKRQKFGRYHDHRKVLRAMSHSTGEDCACKRFQCFKEIPKEERDLLITDFNGLQSKDMQSLHLSGLIKVHPIHRRRPRQKSCDPNEHLHEHSYTYKVLIPRDGKIIEVPVCHKAFISLHGITNQTLYTIKKCVTSGKEPVDGRGKHKNRTHTFSHEMLSNMFDHIKSFPNETNIKKLHRNYLELNPQHTVSYESYRSMFNNKALISFGDPTSDTCSICDDYQTKVTDFENQKVTIWNEAMKKMNEIDQDLQKLTTINEVHKRYCTGEWCKGEGE